MPNLNYEKNYVFLSGNIQLILIKLFLDSYVAQRLVQIFQDLKEKEKADLYKSRLFAILSTRIVNFYY